MILSIGIAVGIYVVLGLLRIVFNIDIIKIFIFSLIIIFILTAITPEEFVPIAFDAGGVITAFNCSVHYGIRARRDERIRQKSNRENGFGLIGLTTIAPILAMLILGVIFG